MFRGGDAAESIDDSAMPRLLYRREGGIDDSNFRGFPRLRWRELSDVGYVRRLVMAPANVSGTSHTPPLFSLSLWVETIRIHRVEGRGLPDGANVSNDVHHIVKLNV